MAALYLPFQTPCTWGIREPLAYYLPALSPNWTRQFGKRRFAFQPRQVQLKRIAGVEWAAARVSGRWLDRHGECATDARECLAAAAERMGVSARSYHRILRVARTIADLDGVRSIEARHVAEAVRYRPMGMAPYTGEPLMRREPSPASTSTTPVNRSNSPA